LDATLRVRWKHKRHSFDSEQLEKIFGEFGELEHVLVSSKKKGSAIIAYKNILGAVSDEQDTLSDRLTQWCSIRLCSRQM
jgi:hypothetical protein